MHHLDRTNAIARTFDHDDRQVHQRAIGCEADVRQIDRCLQEAATAIEQTQSVQVLFEHFSAECPAAEQHAGRITFDARVAHQVAVGAKQAKDRTRRERTVAEKVDVAHRHLRTFFDEDPQRLATDSRGLGCIGIRCVRLASLSVASLSVSCLTVSCGLGGTRPDCALGIRGRDNRHVQQFDVAERVAVAVITREQQLAHRFGFGARCAATGVVTDQAIDDLLVEVIEPDKLDVFVDLDFKIHLVGHDHFAVDFFDVGPNHQATFGPQASAVCRHLALRKRLANADLKSANNRLGGSDIQRRNRLSALLRLDHLDRAHQLAVERSHFGFVVQLAADRRQRYRSRGVLWLLAYWWLLPLRRILGRERCLHGHRQQRRNHQLLHGTCCSRKAGRNPNHSRITASARLCA